MILSVHLMFYLVSSNLCKETSFPYGEIWPGDVSDHDVMDTFSSYFNNDANKKQDDDIQDNIVEIPTDSRPADEETGVEETRRTGTRKFLEWFTNSFKPKRHNDTRTETAALSEYLMENRNLQLNIIEVVENLTESFAKLNKYFEEHAKESEYVFLKVPKATYFNIARGKRSVSENATRSRLGNGKTTASALPENRVIEVNITTEPKVTVTTESKVDVTTEPRVNVTTDHKVNITSDPKVNDTKDPNANVITDSNVTVTEQSNIEQPCVSNDTRRTLDSVSGTNDSLEVKQRLMSYIKESFQEVKSQIEKLQQMKQVYSTDSIFRVGYIVANVDILQDNINKLTQETEASHSTWSDRQLIEVFDKLKASNKVMSGLMQTVRNIYYGDGKNTGAEKVPTRK